MKTHLKIVHIVVEIEINVQGMWVRSNMCSTLVSLTEESHHQHQHQHYLSEPHHQHQHQHYLSEL